MEVQMITSVDELETLCPFKVECLLWGTRKIPDTYGYLGFIPGDGFYLKMVCEEKDPLRTYENHQDPVYRDSAMEAFFMFEPGNERGDHATYLNFEFNANGALLAAYGQKRIYRTYFKPEEMEAFACRAVMEEEQWSVSLRIPVRILEMIYGPLKLGEGSSVACNFYKISETQAVEHYASYAPIRSEVPSFHMPEYFATAKIVKK